MKKSKWNLIIDTHELKIIELFKKEYIKTQLLDVGDFHYVNTETNKTEIIIERKTYSDLYSSITGPGNRYNEQKIRLKSFRNHDETIPILIYLIEGEYGMDTYLNYDILDSAILGTNIRDNFKIIYTQNLNHTINILDKIYNKLDKYINNVENKLDYLNNTTVKTCKKENLTPDICYKMQLTCIPNVSNNIAENICKIYPNFTSLINSINEDENKVYVILKEHKINNRKIGPVLSKKIINYLLQRV